jgi:hypothetical protein
LFIFFILVILFGAPSPGQWRNEGNGHDLSKKGIIASLQHQLIVRVLECAFIVRLFDGRHKGLALINHHQHVGLHRTLVVGSARSGIVGWRRIEQQRLALDVVAAFLVVVISNLEMFLALLLFIQNSTVPRDDDDDNTEDEEPSKSWLNGPKEAP